MRLALFLLACCLGPLAGAAVAQGAHGVAATGGAADARTPEERNRARWPQPVRVGDLIGRQLLRNAPQQTVLGRVVAVTRADGAEAILVDAGGVLGIGTRRVSVPTAATALLGQFIVLMDLDPADLTRLPEVRDGTGDRLAPTETIRIGLTRN